MVTIWDTAQPFTVKPQGWLSGEDGLRLNAYDLYDLLFSNDSSAIKITLREDEDNPIYIPTAKRIVKTKARYVCKDLGFDVVNKTEGLGADGEVPIEDAVKFQAAFAFGQFFEREMFFAKFTSAMLYGLAQGDWCIYLYADPLKPEGTRISCRAIDPKTFFPIKDPKDKTKMVGVRMVEVIIVENKEVLKVQTWLTARAEGHPSYADGEYVEGASITREIQVMEQSDWEDPLKRKKLAHPDNLAQEEVPGIFQLPIYHFKANDKPGELFGVSDISGLERIFYGVNQAVTDEDVGLAMAALGVYVADQKPVDAEGNETDWIIGPKRVVEVEGDDTAGGAKSHFDRVAGITSVEPSQDHIKYLMDMAESTSGVSAVALGEIESAIAESGIALALRFAPLLDDATEKDKFILAKLRQLFHDLKDWFAEYEGITLPLEMEIIPVVGPKLPRDNDKALQVYSDLHLAGVIPTELYLIKLNELGFDLGDPKAVIAAAVKEQEENFARQQEQIDAAGGRLDEEAGSDEEAA